MSTMGLISVTIFEYSFNDTTAVSVGKSSAKKYIAYELLKHDNDFFSFLTCAIMSLFCKILQSSLEGDRILHITEVLFFDVAPRRV